MIMLEHLSIYPFLYITFFHLNVHMCMLVQRFEPQGRRCTNFHYYYYYVESHGINDNINNMRQELRESAREQKIALYNINSDEETLNTFLCQVKSPVVSA